MYYFGPDLAAVARPDGSFVAMHRGTQTVLGTISSGRDGFTTTSASGTVLVSHGSLFDALESFGRQLPLLRRAG